MAAESAAEAITIAVAGRGESAERWMRALRGVDGAAAALVEINSPDDLLQTLARDDIGAIALSGGTDDLAGAIKRALMANRHVLVYGPSAIASKQLDALDALARRRSRVLLFDTEGVGDERVDFVRKMTTGPHALWRPRYVRSLRTGTSAGATLDALAIADIGFAIALLGGMPARVAATAPRIDDESGAADVAMVTLMFEGGPAARIDVSLIEPEPRHEMAVACDGRTLVLDAFNARAPLQIQATARHRGPQRGAWAETIAEHPLTEPGERLARAAKAFITAMRSRDVAASNTRDVADAARVWECARESIAGSGALVEIDGASEIERPKLKLIVGGGHVDSSYPSPDLKIVSGRRAPASERDPEPEPLRTA